MAYPIDRAGAAEEPLRATDWSRARIVPLWFWDTRHVDLGPVEAQRWRNNDHIGFWFLVRGSLRIRYPDERTEEFRAGRAVLQPTVRHQESWSPDAALVSIRVEAAWPSGRPFNRLERTLELSPEASAPLLRLSRSLGAEIHRLAGQHPESKVMLPGLAVAAHGHATLAAAFWPWFAALTAACTDAGHPWQGAGSGDARLDALLALVADWDLGRPLTATAVAATTGLSAAGARRLALRRLGATPRELLERRRQRLAEDQLRWHDQPQRELAARVGFTQAGHFGQWFRRRTGITPRAWLDRERSGRDEA